MPDIVPPSAVPVNWKLTRVPSVGSELWNFTLLPLRYQ
jgi:hypothetical protein